MSRFASRLIVNLPIREAGKRRLLAPLVYFSHIAGEIVVPTGFKTDFASVPRIPFAYLLAGDTAHAAAVIHDFLYRTKKVPRRIADAVFLEAMATSGVPWWRRRIMHLAVRTFGWISY